MDCKEYTTERLTASRVVVQHALELSQLILLSSNGTSDLRVYDGVDTNGDYKLRVRGPNSGMRLLHFNPHIYLRNGLYLEFYQKVDSVTVQYKLRPHGES